jgi:hypothetical protein
MLARLGLQREDRRRDDHARHGRFPGAVLGARSAPVIIPIPLNTLLPVEQFRYILG